jgi:hypothetical protein
MAETPKFGERDVSDRAALEDAKAFNKGKGALLFAMLALLALSVLGFGWYLVQDQPNPYGELGKQINGLRGQYFDGFWTCVLPGKRLAELKNDGDLRGELHTRGEALARYGQHLSGKCRSEARELSVRLSALLPPDDARPLVAQMVDALHKMDDGTRAYADYLQSVEAPYQADAAEPAMVGLVRGWYDFRKAHAALNQLIRDKLGR